MFKEEEVRNHLTWSPVTGKFLLVGSGWVHGYDSLSDAYMDASDYVECWGDGDKLVIIDLENARLATV